MNPIWIPGNPAPQGSKRHVGGGRMIESSKSVKPWRESIRWAVLEVWRRPPLEGSVHLQLEFRMPRPASTPKSRTPPAIKRPDLDKLIRAVLDALGSAGVYWDDSQVTTLEASKALAAVGGSPGLVITIRPAG